MKIFQFKLSLLFFLFLQTQLVYGGVEPAHSSTLSGAIFIPYNLSTTHIPNAQFSNAISDFNISTYSFPANQQVRKIDNLLQLYLDPNSLTYIDFPYTLKVVVDIVKYGRGSTSTTTDVATLEIKYDPKERSQWVEKANFHFVNCGRVDYKINSVTLSSTSVLSDQQKKAVSNVVGLRADIVLERYADFNVNVPLTGLEIWDNVNTASQELIITWQPKPGAEYYDLEWAFVDDYNGTGGKIAPGLLELNKHYNLTRNATRVRVAQTQYSFPLVFESGYILYRVRAIGIEYDPNNDQLYIMPGRWSNPLNNSASGPEQSPNVALWNHKHHIVTGFEGDKLNWQITTSYAEEGKSKSVIGIRDGSERNRQTITGLSTEHVAMVAETIFDHQGRAAIQVLPVPSNDPTLKYYKHFNRNTSGPYNRENFDETKLNCYLSADPMDPTVSGASRYYSPNNPNKTNEKAYIPDAAGYPFVQTEFSPDNTGRIRRQSGVGVQHKLGSGHETNYFYGAPAQEELSMLFGVEVGNADHYKKNVVQDPNGQLSVSFLDLKGKVVATALAGNPPKNLEALPSYQPYSMNIDLMVFNQKDAQANELVATKSITVTTDSYYDFTYTLSNTAFKVALCDSLKLCLDCVYDLEVSVIDNYSCNTLAYQEITQINPPGRAKADGSILVDDACPKPATSYTLDFNSAANAFHVWLKVGSYTITKKLKVNQAATDAYVKHYLQRFETECTSVYNNILQTYLSQVDSAMCEVEDDSKALNRCQVAREGMLADLSPGGQYGQIDWATYDSSDPLSVFNNSASNRLPEANANWKNSSLVYKNEAGMSVLFKNAAGQWVQHYDPSIGLKEFLQSWEPSFAKTLLRFHPEYCYLEWCEKDDPAFDYDVTLALVTTYNEAKTKGYFDFATPGLIQAKDPYFTGTGGGVGSMASLMSAAIAQYYPFTLGIPAHSMLELAVLTELLKTNPSANLNTAQTWILAHPSNPALEDRVWQHFRALYLAKKEQFQYAARTTYAINCTNKGGYNECIGADPFFWHKNGFGSGLFSGGPFYNSNQACSWKTYYLYKDKGIRFPSVYNIPIDFDPYAVPNVALANFSNWANGQISANCDTCLCNKAFTQFINWVINTKPYFPGGQQVLLPAGSFTPQLQQILRKCNDKTITRISAALTNKYLQITLYDNAGANVGMILLQTANNANDWTLADSISCLSYLGVEDGFDVTGGTLFTTVNQAQPVKMIIRPNCLLEKCDVPDQSCPPSENAKLLSQLLNTLISREELNKPVVLNNNYASNSFAAQFTPVVNNQFSLNWNGLLSGNTINATILGIQANCNLTLELPSGLNATNLNTLGNVLSFSPDPTQIDPLTGYTYHGILQVERLTGGAPVFIKVKSSCFPLSYCLKCPPVAGGISPTTKATEVPVPGKKSKSRKISLPEKPVPISIELPIGTLKHDPNKICYPCDLLNYVMDYDSLVNDSLSMMVHQKPPANLCDPCAWPKDTLTTIPMPNRCIEEQIIAAYTNAANEYQQYLDSITIAFREGYIRHCMAAIETFSVKYTDALHHFTLYYYDQANNLVKTIPPNGVVRLSPSATQQAIQYMRNQVGVAITPQHSMPSDYTFNSLNQLRKQSIPDHNGESYFYYDYLSRIVASQNPEQKTANRYSYTLYDPLNRPYETGELLNVATPMTDALAKNETQLLAWVSSNQKREVTKTQYDVPLAGIANQFFNGDNSNYRGRVASVKYMEQGGSPNQHSTYYHYDIHGNVEKLVQDVFQLGPKTIDYVYDLISGNVLNVYYQKGALDQFIHAYSYDADNRLNSVRTSFNGMVWDTDASYSYYAHGPLARTVLGQNEVQGMDFAYTIQGWIKGVNSAALQERIDIGQDGVSGHAHQGVGKDAFGYVLRYFTNDYTMIGAAPGGLGWEPAYQGTSFQRSNRDLYNGNIQSMITAIGEPINANFKIKPLGYAYDYDQLNRIKSMQTFTGLNQPQNNWNSASTTKDYRTKYDYDANGNLLSLNRKGSAASGAPLEMDDFKYNYLTIGGKPSNRLGWVNDAVSNGNYPEDIDNQGQGNYKYDAIGNLIADQAEKLSISWNVAGKVKSIQKTATSERIDFSYDPMGQRVIKRITNTVTKKSTTTYYVLDATGNVMATYNIVETPPLKNKIVVWDEVYVYGSSRVGVERITTSMAALASSENRKNNTWYSYRSRGKKFFELGNHLGNVLATVSDRKLPADGNNDRVVDGFGGDIWTVSDYYPFGAIMPGRSFSSSAYRYGFNGQEKVDEISGLGNHNTAYFGELDTRLGKRWNLDPKSNPGTSSYAVFGNNPIFFIDFALDTPRIYGNAQVTGTTLSDKGGIADNATAAFTFREAKLVPAYNKKGGLVGYNVYDTQDEDRQDYPILQFEVGDENTFLKNYDLLMSGARLYYSNGEPSEGMKKYAAAFDWYNGKVNWSLASKGLKEQWKDALNDPTFVASCIVSFGHVGIAAKGGMTTVGRWMSKAEYEMMAKTGQMVEGAGGQTFVATGGLGAFNAAAKGSVYAEFQVPTNSLLQGGQANWFKVLGPNSGKAMQGALQKQGGQLLPQIQNLSPILQVK